MTERIPPSRRPLSRLALAAALAAGVLLLLLWQEARAVEVSRELAPAGLPPRLVVPVALLGLGLLAGARLLWIVVALAVAALALLLAGDRAALEYFGHPVSVELLAASHQLWEVRKSTAVLLDPLDALAVLGAATGVLLLGHLLAPWRKRARAAGLLLLLPALPAWEAVATPAPADPAAAHGRELRFAERAGLAQYHVRNVVLALRERWTRGAPSPEVEAAAGRLFARAAARNAVSSPLAGVAAGRNVVLLQLEAFQAFVLGLTVPGGPVTPFLDGLARRGLLLERMHDTTGMGRTSSAEFQVLTGMPSHSRELGAYALVHHAYPDSLPATLARHGYSTASLHAYRRDFWNRSVAHPVYGIDTLLFRRDFPAEPHLGWGLRDREFLLGAAERLAEQPAPFLALVITLSSHHPFDAVPGGVADFDTGFAASAPLLDRYLKLVHATDAAVGAFMRRMNELGLTGNTLFVIYGDHDAGLDGPSREALSPLLGGDPSEPAHDRLPAIVLAPGLEEHLAAAAGAVAGTHAGLHDLAPTVLHLLGLPVPAGQLGTHVLVPPAARPPLGLPFESGVAWKGVLSTAWDADWLVSQASREAAWLAARRQQLVDEVLQHGLHVRAAELAAQAGLLPLEEDPWFAGSGAAAPAGGGWVREDEDSTPLPGGVRLVDTVPAADGLLFLTDVLLTNTGDERVEVAVVGHAGGREQARATVAVPAGERRQMALTPSPDDPFRGASHVVVHASDAVVVTTLLRHTFGHTARKAQSSTARRTVWRGEADGVGGMLLTLVNPGERPVTADVRLQCGDEVVQRRRVTVAPGERATVRLHTAGLEGVLTLTAEGEGLTRSLLRWGEQDPWVR